MEIGLWYHEDCEFRILGVVIMQAILRESEKIPSLINLLKSRANHSETTVFARLRNIDRRSYHQQ